MPVTKLTAFVAGAIGQIYRVSLNAVGPDGAHVNTFYLRQVAAAPSGNIFDDIAASFSAGEEADYAAMFPDTWSLQSIRVAQVDNGLKGLPSQTTTSIVPGTRTVSGDRQPGQLAAVAEFNTGFSGRKLRGRNFIGVLHEGDQASGLLGVTMATAIQDWLDVKLGLWVAGSAVAEWVVFNKEDNVVAVVTGAQPKGAIYTQRRRRGGVGA